MRFSKGKWKVLHTGWGNPKLIYRLGGEWIESNPEEKDLWVLLDEKLNTTQQCTLTVQKATHILGCIKSSMASRLRATLLCSDVNLPGILCPALEPSAQERHGPAGACPKEATKNDQRAETTLL